MIYVKNKWFTKWSRKYKITDNTLVDSIKNLEQNKSVVNLGSNLFKLRIASPGRGKSGGFRVIVAYKVKNRTIFLYGFAKIEKDNIKDDELNLFKKLSKDLLALSLKQINELIQIGEFSLIKEEK